MEYFYESQKERAEKALNDLYEESYIKDYNKKFDQMERKLENDENKKMKILKKRIKTLIAIIGGLIVGWGIISKLSKRQQYYSKNKFSVDPKAYDKIMKELGGYKSELEQASDTISESYNKTDIEIQLTRKNIERVADERERRIKQMEKELEDTSNMFKKFKVTPESLGKERSKYPQFTDEQYKICVLDPLDAINKSYQKDLDGMNSIFMRR